jgi:hypothetical protein
VAISSGNLYDVTSEISPQASLVGPLSGPREVPANWIGNLIFCDPEVARVPKRVHAAGALGAITIADVHATAPHAAHSAVYASRVVLARGYTTAQDGAGPFNYSDAPHKDRVWFSELADPFTTWDTTNKYIDTTYEITGLCAIQSALLVFSPRFTEKIINGVPPGEEGEDMELQPIGGVGCFDARSIVVYDNQVIFGSEEGIFLTNGVGFSNLMISEGSTGILRLWQSLFAEHQVRGVVCGMLNHNFLFVSTHSTDGTDYNFVCYVPKKTWWRTKNTTSNMFASGATEQETIEMYGAMRDTPYVGKFSPVLRPSAANAHDGSPAGPPVEPSLETRMFGQGPGLKAFGFGRLTYDLRAGATSPVLAVSQATGLEAESYVAVHESPLPETTKADRARFRLFKDTQALYLKLAQQGPSDTTEVFLVEVEHRPYGLPADGE